MRKADNNFSLQGNSPRHMAISLRRLNPSTTTRATPRNLNDVALEDSSLLSRQRCLHAPPRHPRDSERELPTVDASVQRSASVPSPALLCERTDRAESAVFLLWDKVAQLSDQQTPFGDDALTTAGPLTEGGLSTILTATTQTGTRTLGLAHPRPAASSGMPSRTGLMSVAPLVQWGQQASPPSTEGLCARAGAHVTGAAPCDTYNTHIEDDVELLIVRENSFAMFSISQRTESDELMWASLQPPPPLSVTAQAAALSARLNAFQWVDDLSLTVSPILPLLRHAGTTSFPSFLSASFRSSRTLYTAATPTPPSTPQRSWTSAPLFTPRPPTVSSHENEASPLEPPHSVARCGWNDTVSIGSPFVLNRTASFVDLTHDSNADSDEPASRRWSVVYGPSVRSPPLRPNRQRAGDAREASLYGTPRPAATDASAAAAPLPGSLYNRWSCLATETETDTDAGRLRSGLRPMWWYESPPVSQRFPTNSTAVHMSDSMPIQLVVNEQSVALSSRDAEFAGTFLRGDSPLHFEQLPLSVMASTLDDVVEQASTSGVVARDWNENQQSQPSTGPHCHSAHG